MALRRGDPETAISYLRRAITEETRPGAAGGCARRNSAGPVAGWDLAAAGHLREALADTQEQARSGRDPGSACAWQSSIGLSP